MVHRTAISLLTGSLLVGTWMGSVEAQTTDRADALREHHPELLELVVRVEHAHGILLGALAREAAEMRANGAPPPVMEMDADHAMHMAPPGEVAPGVEPAPGFESDIVAHLTAVVRGDRVGSEVQEAAEVGYALLGERGVEVVRHGQAFQREVLAILADPEIEDPAAALADAVWRYEGRYDIALPAAPKDMDVLYGHDHALSFREAFPAADGLLWAGHWLRLAATEPLTDLPPGAARSAGIDTVTARYHAKLSGGTPPAAFPTEIPLAPAIAPGFIWAGPQAAMIFDNLSMLLEVLGDVLASPETTDVTASIDATLDFFLDPETALTDRDDWEIMALRHGIFFQGGYPLAVMTRSERNTDGHAAHLAGGMKAIPGMPGR